MEVVRRTIKRARTPINVPTMKEIKKTSSRRLAFLGKPLRLRGNSTVSIPLGVVLLFPLIVLVFILVLFVRHPSSPALGILSSVGSPPEIRYVRSNGVTRVRKLTTP